MNPRAVAVGLVLVGFLWVYLAAESFTRGKTGLGIVQGAAALAFAGRGVWSWVKAKG